MRCARVVWLALAGVLASGCGPGTDAATDVLFRHHFAGLAGVGSHPDLPRVREVLVLPETQVVIQDASRKLAVAMPVWFGGAALGTNDALAYQVMVRTLLDAESYLEVRASGGRVAAWALASRLDGPGAMERVGTDLRRLLGAPAGGKPGDPFEVGGSGGGGPGGRYATVGAWAVIGRGRGPFDAYVAELGTSGRPGPAGTNVLEVVADLPRLTRMLGLREKPPGPIDQWPTLRLAMMPRNGQFRTTATLGYAAGLEIPVDDWQIPTNVLRDPLVGFTAVRGAGTWLSRLGVFADLGVTEWPRQLFLWSLAGDPWLQYFAAPIQAPTNLMAQISLTLPVRAVTNMLWSESVFSLRITNQARRVELRGLPYFAPFMEAQRTGEGEQLFGGLFPHAANARPAPAGLLSQVAGRTNLVLYDWETTGRRFVSTNPPGVTGPRVVTNDIGRLIQFKHLAQFTRLMLSQDALRLPSGASGELLIPGARWVDAALPLLRDTVTELTRTGPQELTGSRQSVTGFSALELLYLLRWIENPGFPGWTDVPPTAPRVRPPGRAAAPGSPPAAPGSPGALAPPVKAPGTP